MNESNFIDQAFLDILKLSNDLPPTKMKRARPLTQDPPLSRSQKRRKTAIKDSQAHLTYLQQSLVILNQQRARAIPQPTKELLAKILHTKRTIYQQTYRLRKYQNAIPKCKDGHLEFDTKNDKQFIFLQGLLLHEVEQWRKFVSKYGNKELIMENQWGDKFPRARMEHFKRLEYLHQYLVPGELIYFNAKDARWLIRHIFNIQKRLQRESAINEYLPPANTEDRTNTMARRKQGEKVYSGTPLDEIHTDRKIRYLMDFWGCQLRETERAMLIKIAGELRDKLLEEFTVK